MHNGRFDSLRNITRQRVSSYKLAYLLAAGLIVIVELAFHTLSDALAAPAVLVLALLGVTLAVAPWIGIAGDVLYIAAFVAADFSGYTESLSFPLGKPKISANENARRFQKETAGIFGKRFEKKKILRKMLKVFMRANLMNFRHQK